MQRIFSVFLLVSSVLLLVGCVQEPMCGNNVCEANETNLTCSLDCGSSAQSNVGIGATVLPPKVLSSDQNTTVSFTALKNIAADLKNSFASQGYWVADGNYSFLSIGLCAQLVIDYNNCLGLNPASPYGYPNVPRAPGETTLRLPEKMAKDLGMPDTNLLMTWRMRADEAIVLIGLTPPEAKFYSYIPYLTTRDAKYFGPVTKLLYLQLLEAASTASESSKEIMTTMLGVSGYDSNRLNIDASFNFPINNKVILTSNKNYPFNAATVLIITADKRLDASIRNMLQDKQNGLFKKYGFPADFNIINTVIVPAEYMHLGYGKDADMFQMLARMSYVTDVNARDAYIKNPPYAVLRIVPTTPEDTSQVGKYSFTPVPSRTTALTEVDYNAALTALIAAVKLKEAAPTRDLNKIFLASYAYVGGIPLNIDFCLRIGVNCVGDDPDAAYGFLLPENAYPIVQGKDNFLIAVGMNHHETGKATYSNLSLYNNHYNLGFKSISNVDMLGSITEYLSYLRDVNASASAKAMLVQDSNKFFVYKIARECGDVSQKGALAEPYCYAIPQLKLFCTYNGVSGQICTKEDQVLGMGVTDTLEIYERAYLNPLSNFGPDYNQQLPTTYLRYVAK